MSEVLAVVIVLALAGIAIFAVGVWEQNQNMKFEDLDRERLGIK